MTMWGLFGTNENENQINIWTRIESIESLENAFLTSYEKNVVILKHSDRCSISRFAKRRLENEISSSSSSDCIFYLIDVVNFRSISISLAEKVNVQHESPQLLVISKGMCVKNASHEGVNWPLY